MDKTKRKRLESAGWKIGTVKGFLDLSSDESAYIEIKLQLAKNLQKRRIEKRLTQIEVARLLNSSQSRVAKMEAGDPTVSVDLLIRSLLTLGARPKVSLRSIAQ
jgi:predicted XRE-type DNA-binding protein